MLARSDAEVEMSDRGQCAVCGAFVKAKFMANHMRLHGARATETTSLVSMSEGSASVKAVAADPSADIATQRERNPAAGAATGVPALTSYVKVLLNALDIARDTENEELASETNTINQLLSSILRLPTVQNNSSQMSARLEAINSLHTRASAGLPKAGAGSAEAERALGELVDWYGVVVSSLVPKEQVFKDLIAEFPHLASVHANPALLDGSAIGNTREPAIDRKLKPTVSPADLVLQPFTKPGARYNGWIIAAGVIISVATGFMVSSWMLNNVGITSAGVPFVISLIGFGITGWLARKRS
jgi:hypothetical protein